MPWSSPRFVVRAAAALAVAAFIPVSGGAQPALSGTVRIVVPTPAGSPPDVLSRVIANELNTIEGWRVVVENRPGATQTIGVGDVLKQPADGRTILAMTIPMLAAPALLPKVNFHLETDIAPVIKVSKGYNVLVVSPSVPATSVREFIAVLKASPHQFNFSSAGIGNPAHLIGEMFKLRTGTQATHVPYHDGGQFVNDLIEGRTQFAFITSVRVVGFVTTGKLRALAVMGPNRIPALPNIPTIVEQGFPDLAVEDWVGFGVKAGTPADAIRRLNGAVNRLLTRPDVQADFAKFGHAPAGGTPEEFGALIRSQLAHWSAVIHDAGIKAQ